MEDRDVHRQGQGEEAEAPGDSLPFEVAFAKLEEIVRKLETGDVGLEESLALFEEGVRMARACSRRLDEAETRIRRLVDDGGTLREEPWQLDRSSLE